MDEIFRKNFYYPNIVYFMRSLYIVVITLKKNISRTIQFDLCPTNFNSYPNYINVSKINQLTNFVFVFWSLPRDTYSCISSLQCVILLDKCVNLKLG